MLPIQYKNQFANKQIQCVEYDGLVMEAEREIFQVRSSIITVTRFSLTSAQRVQLGVALTPAGGLHVLLLLAAFSLSDQSECRLSLRHGAISFETT